MMFLIVSDTVWYDVCIHTVTIFKEETLKLLSYFKIYILFSLCSLFIYIS